MDFQNKIIKAIEDGVYKALNEKHGVYDEVTIIYDKIIKAYENKNFINAEKDKNIEKIYENIKLNFRNINKIPYPNWIIQIEYNNNYIYVLYNNKLSQYINHKGFASRIFSQNIFYIYINNLHTDLIYHELTHIINNIYNRKNLIFNDTINYVFMKEIYNNRNFKYITWVLTLEELHAETNELYAFLNNTYKQLHNEYAKTLYILYLNNFFI